MELETYTSVVVVLSAAFLLVAAGLAKKQLVWRGRARYRHAGAGALRKRRWFA